jgi:hypothetical protein
MTNTLWDASPSWDVAIKYAATLGLENKRPTTRI